MWLWLVGDQRLIGRWRSDLEKTTAEFAARNDISDERRSKLASLFGRLELRYTRWRCYSTFDGTTNVARYRVLAKDADSVAVLSSRRDGFGGSIFHIHFDNGYYWITLGNGGVREFFRRVE